jgi:CheY-like chemotaxis protein
MPRDGELTIVVVDDDDVAAMAVERGLLQARIANRLVHARDGIEALELLRGHAGVAPLALPHLLLVDLHMPRLDGIGLIRAIRADAGLARSIIFVLTASDDDRDKLAAYQLHVAGYILKSTATDVMLPLVSMLGCYLLIVEPPPADGRPPGA